MSPEAFSIAVLIAIAVVAVLAIVVALPVVLSMRQAARDREYQHAERLKALELGRPFPGESGFHGPCSSAGVGIWVPIAVFGIALAATQAVLDSGAALVAVWGSAGCVGVTALICGTVLTLRNAERYDRIGSHAAAAKPAYEEPEFDTE